MAEWDKGHQGSHAVPLKGLVHRILPVGLILSEPQHWGNSCKGTRDIWGKLNCLASGWELRVSFLPDKSAGRDQCSFSNTSPHRAGSQVQYLSLHQPGSHSLPRPGESLRPCPTQLVDPPKLLPMAFPYKWPVLAHPSDFPKSLKQAASGLSVSYMSC